MKLFNFALLIFGLTNCVWLAHAEQEDAFLMSTVSPQLEQTLGRGHSALWTLSTVATQYQSAHPTPLTRAALAAQNEGRYLEALIHLDQAAAKEAGKTDSESAAQLDLLRASFLLQGKQTQQVKTVLSQVLKAAPGFSAECHALIAMAHLQEGALGEALVAAQRARDAGDSILPHLALSYALQSQGRLAEARAVMQRFNGRVPPDAIGLAREAELALTLGETDAARERIALARQLEAAHPYVVAVSGLVYLIDGQATAAKAAFEQALRRDPQDAKALLGLGLAEIKLGNVEAGKAKLQAAHATDPNNALVLTYLGRAQQHLGETEAASASWRSAQKIDPHDPAPWLYQAQAQLQANTPQAARDSLRQAQARSGHRAVYRGERLLQEDEQLLQANLAEAQRRLGLEGLAFHTLADTVGEKNAAHLRNQADILQGQRFGESARRSLLLQSQFNDKPGNLPAMLDVYGDGAGQTGASTPQHGVVSGLDAQQASFNDYGALFSQPARLSVDASSASRNSQGEQIRVGVGSDTLGLSFAQRQFATDGYARFDGLDNRVRQGTLQWQPLLSTQAFASYQTFDSVRGEVFFPADPFFGSYNLIEDSSEVARLGLRHSLAAGAGELRALWSSQRTEQKVTQEDFSVPPLIFSYTGSGRAQSEELQYRRSSATSATQWGVQQFRGRTIYDGGADYTRNAQQFYAAWQQRLHPAWQVEVELALGKMLLLDNTGGGNDTRLQRWLPKLGAVYAPDAATHLRVAAWRGMGYYSVGDATLAPVSVAGMLLARPSDQGKLVQAVAVSGDRQIATDWLLAAQVQQRETHEAVINGGQQAMVQRFDEAQLAAHWQPAARRWAIGLAHEYERIRNPAILSTIDSVDEQRLNAQKLTLRWFLDAQWVGNLVLSRNRVVGTQESPDPLLAAYRDSFNQVDASFSWQFRPVLSAQRGLLNLGVRNAADTRFQYADTDRLNPRYSTGRLIYAKINLAW